MILCKVLLDQPHIGEDNLLHLFNKFVYSETGDVLELDKIIKNLLHDQYFVVSATLATEDEEIAYLDGHGDGLDNGWRDRMDSSLGLPNDH